MPVLAAGNGQCLPKVACIQAGTEGAKTATEPPGYTHPGCPNRWQIKEFWAFLAPPWARLVKSWRSWSAVSGLVGRLQN